MAKPRSLIEQAVLDFFAGSQLSDVWISPVHVGSLRDAMTKQLKEEAVQRDHRYRRQADELLADCTSVARVDACAQIEHGVEIGGITGAWVHARVFVTAHSVEDE